MKAIAKSLASILFLALIGIEYSRIIAEGHVMTGYTAQASGAAYMMMGIWLLGAVVVSLSLESALPWLVTAIFFTLAYGLSIAAGGSTRGLLFVGASVVELLLSIYGFTNDGRERTLPEPKGEKEVEERHAA